MAKRSGICSGYLRSPDIAYKNSVSTIAKTGGGAIELDMEYAVKAPFRIAYELMFDVGVRSESFPEWKFKRIKAKKKNNLFLGKYLLKLHADKYYEICCGMIDMEENRTMYKLLKFQQLMTLLVEPRTFLADHITKNWLVSNNSDSKTANYSVAYFMKTDENGLLANCDSAHFGLILYSELQKLPGFGNLIFEDFETDAKNLQTWITQNPMESSQIIIDLIESGVVKEYPGVRELIDINEISSRFQNFSIPAEYQNPNAQNLLVSYVPTNLLCPDYEQYIPFVWTKENWFKL
ncbi:MAG: hypothetical protein FWG98_06750 [Candidatus Cloacimonetes bacterium]|nr:hypothetical protein [Candidatus Cloacimonadota bacterium]